MEDIDGSLNDLYQQNICHNAIYEQKMLFDIVTLT